MNLHIDKNIILHLIYSVLISIFFIVLSIVLKETSTIILSVIIIILSLICTFFSTKHKWANYLIIVLGVITFPIGILAIIAGVKTLTRFKFNQIIANNTNQNCSIQSNPYMNAQNNNYTNNQGMPFNNQPPYQNNMANDLQNNSINNNAFQNNNLTLNNGNFNSPTNATPCNITNNNLTSFSDTMLNFEKDKQIVDSILALDISVIEKMKMLSINNTACGEKKNIVEYILKYGNNLANFIESEDDEYGNSYIDFIDSDNNFYFQGLEQCLAQCKNNINLISSHGAFINKIDQAVQLWTMLNELTSWPDLEWYEDENEDEDDKEDFLRDFFDTIKNFVETQSKFYANSEEYKLHQYTYVSELFSNNIKNRTILMNYFINNVDVEYFLDIVHFE